MFKKLASIFLLTASAAAMSQPAIDFIKQSREGLAQQTASHVATWRLGEEERWSADLTTGTITFHFKNGTNATAPIQVVGTYNTLDGTFLWGWDHPSVPEPLRKHAQLARQWGDKNNVADFKQRKVSCSEGEAWDFAAVANRLGKGNGVFRGRDGTVQVLMTFGEIKLERAKP